MVNGVSVYLTFINDNIGLNVFKASQLDLKYTRHICLSPFYPLWVRPENKNLYAFGGKNNL